MRHRLVPSSDLAINSAVINYFEIPHGKFDYSDPDYETLKYMQKSIKQKLKEKYPLAKKTNIDDYLYILFREIVKADMTNDKLFPRISPRARRPLLAALFAKSHGMERICEEIKNYWFYNSTYTKSQIQTMTVATIMMLEKACFQDGKLFCDTMEDEFAELMKQIIPPTQWKKLARYAIEQMNYSLCILIRDHFDLPEKEQDKIDAALVAARLVEMG